MRSKHRLGALLSATMGIAFAVGIALFFLSTFCASPVLAQDRIFLDLSLDFLGEYQLPKMNFIDTPVGGFSALAYDKQRDSFYAISSDRSQFAPARFYTFKLSFNANDSEKIGLQIDIESVTFITDNAGKTYPQGTIAPEGIALTPQQTVFISSGIPSDITSFVQEFDLKTGRLRTSLPIPERYFPNTANKNEPLKGVQESGGFASLTLNPIGSSKASGEPINLFTATATALVQDLDPLSSKQEIKSRLLHYLIGYGPPVLISEYYYRLDSISDTTSNELVELLAIDQGGHFLSLERSRGESGFNARIFQMTTGGATDTSRIASLKGSLNGIQPVKKKLLLDLNKLGIPLDNLQGMTLGPRLPDGTQSLLIVSDNNLTQQATQFLLFRLSRAQAQNHR